MTLVNSRRIVEVVNTKSQILRLPEPLDYASCLMTAAEYYHVVKIVNTSWVPCFACKCTCEEGPVIYGHLSSVVLNVRGSINDRFAEFDRK